MSYEESAESAYFQHCQELINRHGCMVQGVLPSTADELPFCYTVGLTPRGRPEFIIDGIVPDVATAILNSLVALAMDGVHLDTDIDIHGIINGLPLRLLWVIDTDDLGIARRMYGEHVAAMQVTWPDAQGVFPWEEGFSGPAVPLRGIPARTS